MVTCKFDIFTFFMCKPLNTVNILSLCNFFVLAPFSQKHKTPKISIQTWFLLEKCQVATFVCQNLNRKILKTLSCTPLTLKMLSASLPCDTIHWHPEFGHFQKFSDESTLASWYVLASCFHFVLEAPIICIHIQSISAAIYTLVRGKGFA